MTTTTAPAATRHEVAALDALHAAHVALDDASGLGHIADAARPLLANALFDLFGAQVQGAVLTYLSLALGRTVSDALDHIGRTHGQPLYR